MQIRIHAAAIFVLLLAGGCAVQQPVQPTGIANTTRDQIGRMAIRGPDRPKVALVANLDTKGAAARKTAVSAGATWLGGSFEAAGQAGEGGLLIAAFGLVTAPIVAAGGAVYGAAAADTEEEIANGNEALVQTLDFAPAHMRRALENEFVKSAPIEWAFVDSDASNAELAERGFDSVLDMDMDSIASHVSANDFHVYFDTLNRLTLTNLASGQTLATRKYWRELPSRAVSEWAGEGGNVLTNALYEQFADIAGDVADDLFLFPAIRVQGVEPVSRRRFSAGIISGRRPMFVWTAFDGARGEPAKGVEYELAIGAGKEADALSYRTPKMRYVPPNSLNACSTYSWKVRAHYLSFGEPATSEWSPEYRFKTPCRR
ncbi:MAG: hypothetical protein GWM88_08975 [Pseudomonadales bacterium]|nr:hypothetical protein [Pseudomonadales bacterium]NIX08133.1 hypothetical protein [Pseudomonadales bacterium]